MLRMLLAAVALVACSAAGAAAADCRRSVPPDIRIDPSKMAGFGKFERYPVLPLEAEEFVLTIDDGPDPRTTPELVRILQDRCVPATFFLIGRKAAQHPELVRLVEEAGFSIGNHSFSHRPLGKLDLEEAIEDVREGQDAISDALGGGDDVRPRLFRFPSGSKTPELVAAVRDMGLTIASTDISPEDWRGDPPDVSFERFVDRMKPVTRGVILLHDSQPNTVLLLPKILDDIAARGGRFARLDVSGPASPR